MWREQERQSWRNWVAPTLWAREWACLRKYCLPCIGQSLIAAEIELESLRKVVGDENVADDILEEIGAKGNKGEVKISKEDRKSLPGCTKEGCNYVLECLKCRKEG